jgi:glycosyltransferase involved in cell wall biosynthesis
MIKVLHLIYEDIENPTGGLGVHCRGISKALGKMNCYSFLCIISQSLDRGRVVPYAENVDLYRIAHIGGWFTHHSMDFQRCLEYDYLVNMLSCLSGMDTKFDLIHVHDSHLWRPAVALQHWLKIPIVMTSHLSPLLHGLQYSNHAIDSYKCQTEGEALCESSMVLAVSKDYYNSLKDMFEFENIRCIGNGVDLEILNQVEEDRSILDILKFKNDNPNICLVGRLTEQKGIMHFIDAARALPNVNFTYICHLSKETGSTYPECAKVIAAEKELSNFQWVQDITWGDKYKLMKAMDMGCMPSVFEPFGIAALEWMCLKIPLLVSDTGGLKEFCNEANSILLEPGSVQSLVNAIENFKYDGRKVEAGYATAQTYSWESVASRTLSAYREVTNGR